MAHRVFISHATEDRDLANRVCALLEAEGISCWIAPRDVEAGTDYAAAILDGIRTSDLVLLIFSAHANASPYVLREIERAVAYKRPILALRVDDTAPIASIEYYVNVWERLDASAGIDTRQAEIVAAVHGALVAPVSARGSRPGGAGRQSEVPGWSRRRWTITVAVAALAVASIGLGVGLGLYGTSEPVRVPSQVTWSILRPQGSVPTARGYHDAVQDPTSGKLIMFGGWTYSGVLNDTWAYDPAANTWADLTPSGPLPSARGSAAMVYDPSTLRMIMFGGVDGVATRLNDTWAYDPVDNAWTELSPAGPVPAGRGGHVMVYEPSSERILMFGGRVGEMDFLNDMWAFDGEANTWTKLSPDGDLPAVRGNASMAFDPAARRMILFGGQNLETEFGDTWTYDPVANKWTELHPSGTLPTPRSGQDLVCDSSRVVLIMFGGSYDPSTGLGFDYFNETWTYDPFANIWTKLHVLGGAAPSPRSGQSVVYDPSGGRLIMFGGNMPMDAYLDDTWACKL